MRTIYGLGETVLDILFKDGQPVTAKAGGSVLNALISLARMGHNCQFITELGNDKVGKIITDFMEENKLGTQFIEKYEQGQSALAMAFLNEQNDAEYEFFKNYPEERLTLPLPDFTAGDIFLFGSSYAVSPIIRKQVLRITKHAKERGCIIIYDPNFRKGNKNQPEQTLSFIKENMELADIVRASNEDLSNIFDTYNSSDSYSKLRSFCTNLVYSANSEGVIVHSGEFKKHYAVPKIKPVSTIGAGDNFNAGIIHGLLKANFLKEELNNLNEQQWDELSNCGIQFATTVCLSLDNYINKGFMLS